MKLLPSIRVLDLPAAKSVFLVITVAVLAALAGVSTLVFPSPYAPLLVLGGLVAIRLLAACVAKPVWALYAALLLVLLPIGLIPPGMHSILNRFMTVLAAAVWGIRLMGAHRKIVWTGPTLLMLLFLLWSSLTMLWAQQVDPAATTLQVYLLRFLLFLLLIPNEIRTRKDLDGLMKTLAASGWILMGSVIVTLWTQGYTAGTRLQIFSENENGAGVLSLVVMAGVLWPGAVSVGKFRTVKKLAVAGYILLTVGLVAMSGSRGSTISLLVALAAFWFWRPLRGWGWLGMLAAIAALVYMPSIFTTLLERFALQGGDTVLGGREILWQAGWRLIEGNPLLGVGIGNSPFLSTRFLEPGLKALVAGRVAVHNPILVIWSETGMPGLLLYLGVLASALVSFGRSYVRYRRLVGSPLIPYFALVSCITLGYSLSWIKGGGMESDFSYFLIIALLSLPSVLDASSFASGASADGLAMGPAQE